jgi:hypothetical protein
MIQTELNENSRIPQWLVDAVHHAERSGVRLTITTLGPVKPKKKAAKP